MQSLITYFEINYSGWKARAVCLKLALISYSFVKPKLVSL